jgi:hypothetical protein
MGFHDDCAVVAVVVVVWCWLENFPPEHLTLGVTDGIDEAPKDSGRAHPQC